MKTIDINREFITHSLEQIVDCILNDTYEFVGDLQRAYFLGATLCLDVPNRVICVNFSSETLSYAFPLGGDVVTKRLLSLKDLRMLRFIMLESGISFKDKEYI